MKSSSPPVHSSAKGDKYYVVPMFPYPSGKLHMGHARNYAIADAYARHARSRGRDVLFPMGWDSFGLPAEKAAMTMGVDPKTWTESNIAEMREQLHHMDLSFDWSHELATHEPRFYRHTQAIFCALMHKSLVYKKEAEVWWDPVDSTVLANEQVVDGLGWRSGAPAKRRSMAMYWIKTSAYAQEMAKEPLAWSSGALADHQGWLGVDESSGVSRLRDWCVSRQRAWGTPVPAIECESCGSSPMHEADLPHIHAEMGKSCSCPVCGGQAVKSRETLDTFFDSSWYFLRYPEVGSAGSSERPFGDKARAWAPVDLYVGGREHATMHLVYARFMSRALSDCGYDIPREPFARYMAQGMVKAKAYSVQADSGVKEWVSAQEARKMSDGSWTDASGRPARDEGVVKMSKSKLNGVDPADVIAAWGVDAMRLFLFFAAPFEFDMEWDERGLSGCSRFAKRFQTLAASLSKQGDPGYLGAADAAFDQERRELNRFAIAQFERHEGLNGLVAAIMKRSTQIERASEVSLTARRRSFLDACRALSPLAPSLARSCAVQVDPAWTESEKSESEPEPAVLKVKVALQCEGRFVDAATMEPGLGRREAFEAAVRSSEKFRAKIEKAGATWEQAVWVENRAINARGPTR